ncbi:helix-turn-helix domain-containing protein, partial [Streptococcus uberis]
MNRIKQLRKSKGNLTQEKLAKIIGVSKRTIIAWEKDERQIRRDKVKELAKYFDVPISYLL